MPFSKKEKKEENQGKKIKKGKKKKKAYILLLKGALFNLILENKGALFHEKGHFSEKSALFFHQINMYLK